MGDFEQWHSVSVVCRCHYQDVRDGAESALKIFIDEETLNATNVARNIILTISLLRYKEVELCRAAHSCSSILRT